jgi:hypothetical protein
MDTSVLHVKWLGDEHVKQEAGGSSAGGREVHEKSCHLWLGMHYHVATRVFWVS